MGSSVSNGADKSTWMTKLGYMVLLLAGGVICFAEVETLPFDTKISVAREFVPVRRYAMLENDLRVI